MNKKSVVLLFLLMGYSLTGLAARTRSGKDTNPPKTRNFGLQHNEDDWLSEIPDDDTEDEDYTPEPRKKSRRSKKRDAFNSNEVEIQTDVATPEDQLLMQALTDQIKKLISSPEINRKITPTLNRIASATLGQVKKILDARKEPPSNDDAAPKLAPDKSESNITLPSATTEATNIESNIANSPSSTLPRESSPGSQSAISSSTPAPDEDETESKPKQPGFFDMASDYFRERLVDPEWFTQIKKILSTTSKGKSKALTAFKAIKANLEATKLTVNDVKAKLGEITMSDQVKKDFDVLLSNYEFSKKDLPPTSVARSTRSQQKIARLP